MRSFLLLLVSMLFVIGCKPEPQPIDFNNEPCGHCRMTIADKRYGAEIVTKKGRVFKYDAVECMVNSLYKDKTVNEDEVFSLWVIDFSMPGNLINAEQSSYLISNDLPSPMGMFITAIANKQEADEISKLHQGEVLNWEQVKTKVLQPAQ